jgi:myo-inositol-1(or 4)-monophosphatase
MSLDTPPSDHLDTGDLKEIYDFALSLGRNAGKILLAGVEKRCGEESGRWQGQEDKESAVDIVTQTDLGTSTSQGYPVLGQARLTLL